MESPVGRRADLSLERKRSERKRQRQKDESSLRSCTHCQVVDVKAHNYTQRQCEQSAANKGGKKTTTEGRSDRAYGRQECGNECGQPRARRK